jgi:hypothetical protein
MESMGYRECNNTSAESAESDGLDVARSGRTGPSVTISKLRGMPLVGIHLGDSESGDEAGRQRCDLMLRVQDLSGVV